MIRHIVMWKFREGTEREQEQFLTGLQGLFGVIPQLRRCEVKRCVGKDNWREGWSRVTLALGL